VENAMVDELTRVAEESARGGFFLISGTALATIIMAIASIIIARLLGPELYGQYTLALVTPQLLLLFTDLGINQGIIKFTASFRAKKENWRVKRVIMYGLILRATAGTIIFVVNYFFADFFAATLLQRPELTLYVRIAAISVLFQAIFTTITSAFVGLDRTEYNALASNIQASAKAIISLSLVLLGFSIAGAVIGYVMSYAVAAILSLAILIFAMRENKKIQDEGDKIGSDLKAILHYGVPLYISILLTGFIPIYQNVVLAFFITDVDIGNYKAAINFISLMQVLTVPITTALLPAFSKLNSSTEEKVRTFYKLANKYTAIIIIPLTFLIIILSREIVEIIYGYAYQSASLFLAMYSLLYFLVGFGYLVLPSLYNGLGETKMTLKMSLITFVALAFLSPMFTKAYNVQGLIAAFLVASACGTIYGLYTARKNFRIAVETGVILKIYINSAISSIPALLVLNFGRLSTFLTIALSGLLYLSVYVTLTPITRTVTSSELEKAKNVIRKTKPLALVAKPILAFQQKLVKSGEVRKNL
jgi:O-antigen/teichoic acid export membrane protein